MLGSTCQTKNPFAAQPLENKYLPLKLKQQRQRRQQFNLSTIRNTLIEMSEVNSEYKNNK